jgi:hypothetical protein
MHAAALLIPYPIWSIDSSPETLNLKPELFPQ